MPDMSILEFVSKSMPFAVFILILLNVVQTTIMFIMWKTISKMKDNVIWEKQFDEFKDDVNRRLGDLERLRNGT